MYMSMMMMMMMMIMIMMTVAYWLRPAISAVLFLTHPSLPFLGAMLVVGNMMMIVGDDCS